MLWYIRTLPQPPLSVRWGSPVSPLGVPCQSVGGPRHGSPEGRGGVRERGSNDPPPRAQFSASHPSAHASTNASTSTNTNISANANTSTYANTSTSTNTNAYTSPQKSPQLKNQFCQC